MKISELQALIGQTEDQVRELIKDQMEIRILRRDDIHYIGTKNYRMDRLNLYLRDNKVIKASVC